MIKDMLVTLINYAYQHGELSGTSYYGQDFATIDFIKDDKVYTISLRSEKVKTDAER